MAGGAQRNTRARSAGGAWRASRGSSRRGEDMSNQVELGVNEVAKRIHLRLRRYLEAQYHIRNSALIQERRMLLEEPGGIAQRPYIEVTPSYAVASGFSEVNAPATVKGLLQELV